MIQMNALNRWRPLSKSSRKEMIALLKRLDEASYAGDITSLTVLLEEDKMLLDRTLTEVRDNPLHIAAFHGHVDFASEILRLKPELAKKLNKEGQSPLHIAAARGHLQVADKLIDQVGTDICLVPDKGGYLPIHSAAIHGKYDVVLMLIERCQQTLHELTSANETLLHLAVKSNSLEIIHFLMSRGVKLDAKDDKGNTCLHIAVARRNYRVITDLLQYVGIEINSINATGQTPLDVLCESWQYFDDVSLVNMIRTAGGMRAVELTDLESITINSSSHVTSSIPETRTMIANHTAVEKNHDASTLLLVATLVATITFQGALNPPGGFVQGDSNNTDRNNLIPDSGSLRPGDPVLLYHLRFFYVLDCSALFASVSVILLLLCWVPQNKILMKFLVWVVWFAVFCTILAFTSVFIALYFSNDRAYNWIIGLNNAWFSGFIIAMSWIVIRVIIFLLRFGTLEVTRPNWIAKLRCPKLSTLFRKTISIISIVCVLAIFSLLTWQICKFFML